MTTTTTKLTTASLKVLSILQPSSPTAIWRLAAIVFVLLNLKSLPFIWHLRLFSGIFAHILLHPRASLSFTGRGPQALFQPLVTRSSTPILECDYNLHKSNSTYFSDLDISRTHLVSCLCAPIFRDGLKDRKETKGKIQVMLGAVSCSFRREIRPGEGFEIWSRVLSWDAKWLYIVSHFVKKGAVKSKGYTLQPKERTQTWLGSFKSRRNEKNANQSDGYTKDAVHPLLASSISDPPHPAIFATALSKYVFKISRRTVPPETILLSSDLLPPKPSHIENTPTPTSTPSFSPSPPESSCPPTEPSSSVFAVASSLPSLNSSSTDGPPERLNPQHIETDEQYGLWENVERERKKGLKIAESLVSLDAAHWSFSGEEEPVLGVYRDLIW